MKKKPYESMAHIAAVKCLTFTEIERRAHVPKGTIESWQNKPPDWGHLMRICSAVHVDISDVV